jgi:hypothetical protein
LAALFQPNRKLTGLLTNINAEAAVMMVVVMVVVVVMMTMPVRRSDNAVIAVMVVVMMVMVVLRDLLGALRLCRSDARIIYLQRIQCIRNRLQEITITGRWRVLRRLGNGGLCGAHCRQCSRSAQKPGDLLIHLFSPLLAAAENGAGHGFNPS